VKRPKIVVVGSSNTDMVVKAARIPAPGETVLGGAFVMAAGGKGANQAVAAARLGAEVTLVARLGADSLGDEAIAGYQKDSILTDLIVRDPDRPTGVALILVDAHGENSITVALGANEALSPADVERAADRIRMADAVVMQLEVPLAAVERAATIARAPGRGRGGDRCHADGRPAVAAQAGRVGSLARKPDRRPSMRAGIGIAVAWLAAATCAAAPAGRPNVVIVITDDQGYGELSCHGNPVLRTPNLDRLHDESVRLVDFHVAPMCTPTRGQLMTGVDAFRNGAMNVSSGRSLLRPEFPTLGEMFRASGYATGLFGKWHLGDTYPYRPQDRGFDETLWFPSSHLGSVPDAWDNDYFNDRYIRNSRRTATRGYSTDMLFREAFSWMKRESEAGRPFFCYLAPAAAHQPHFVPARYREQDTTPRHRGATGRPWQRNSRGFSRCA